MSLVARSLFRASCMVRRVPVRGIDEFLDTVTKEGEYPLAGRSWRASELRLKSFEDLHKLWYVLLKERNMLETERTASKARGQRMKNPTRVSKVRKSMARIKLVLSERERLGLWDPTVEKALAALTPEQREAVLQRLD